jgi:hypothetical protein
MPLDVIARQFQSRECAIDTTSNPLFVMAELVPAIDVFLV